MQNVENLIKVKADDGSEEMTKVLRERAADAGWPEEVVNNLSITFDGSNIKFDFPQHLEEQVYDLEYGTLTQPPSAVMRGLMYRIAGFMDEIIDDELLDTMVMSEEVLHG